MYLFPSITVSAGAEGWAGPSQGGHLSSTAAPQTGPPRTVLPQDVPFPIHIYTFRASPRNPWSFLPQDGCKTTEPVFRTTPQVSSPQPQTPSQQVLTPHVPRGLPLSLPRSPRQSHSPTRPSSSYRCPHLFPPPLRPHGPRPAPRPLPCRGPTPRAAGSQWGSGRQARLSLGV